MPEEQKIARQPFTFGGVARFADAKIGRLLVVAFAFGIVSGVVVSWLAATRIAPVVDEAIAKLPSTGAIETGRLSWPEKSGRLLAANAFVSIEVSLDEVRAGGAPVDFAIQFRTTELLATSLLGTMALPYPGWMAVEFNQTVMSPAWGAWRGPILTGLIPGTALALLVCWGGLALVYAFVPTFVGSLFGRALGYRGAWKMAVAAQLPGSLMMAFALALYSTGRISILFVLAMFVAHFVPTLLYLLVSPLLTSKAEVQKENPFDREDKPKQKRKNPFSGK